VVIELNKYLSKVKNIPKNFFSEFNIPCLYCLKSYFPITSFDQAFDIMFKKFKRLKKYKNKIIIKKSKTESSRIFYPKQKNDIFQIIINENENYRHQILALIHELLHIVVFLEKEKIKDPYNREKAVFGLEVSLFKQIDLYLLTALFVEILLVIRNTIFEIEIYKNKIKNISYYYAKTFNFCFQKAKQKKNYLFLFDEKIVLRPFFNLSHAVAAVNFLNEYFFNTRHILHRFDNSI